MVRNIFIGNLIGNSLGKTIEVGLNEGEIDWGKYMRVRVTLDVTKPIIRNKRLAIEDMKPASITFSHERLLDFCYWCRLMGHGHRDCD